MSVVRGTFGAPIQGPPSPRGCGPYLIGDYTCERFVCVMMLARRYHCLSMVSVIMLVLCVYMSVCYAVCVCVCHVLFSLCSVKHVVCVVCESVVGGICVFVSPVSCACVCRYNVCLSSLCLVVWYMASVLCHEICVCR